MQRGGRGGEIVHASSIRRWPRRWWWQAHKSQGKKEESTARRRPPRYGEKPRARRFSGEGRVSGRGATAARSTRRSRSWRRRPKGSNAHDGRYGRRGPWPCGGDPPRPGIGCHGTAGALVEQVPPLPTLPCFAKLPPFPHPPPAPLFCPSHAPPYLVLAARCVGGDDCLACGVDVCRVCARTVAKGFRGGRVSPNAWAVRQAPDHVVKQASARLGHGDEDGNTIRSVGELEGRGRSRREKDNGRSS